MHRSWLATVALATTTLIAPAAAQTRAPANAAKPAATAGAPTDAPRTIDIVATDEMRFSVTSIAARPGERLRVRLIVRGAIPKIVMAHNFVLLKAGTNELKFVEAGARFRDTDFIDPALRGSVLAATAMGGPGETVQVVFKAPATPGTYPFVCTFAGHTQSGMKGVLIVK